MEENMLKQNVVKAYRKCTLPLPQLGAALLLLASTAFGVQEPDGCNANNADVDLQRDKVNIVSGATVNYTITIENPVGGTGCDVLLVNGLSFICPGPDGLPSGAVTQILPPGTVLPGFGTGFLQVEIIPCVVTVNAGVNSALAKVEAPGALLQDNPEGAGSPANIDKTISVNILHPCIDVTKVCVNECTPYGDPILYTITVANCGDTGLSGVSVIDTLLGTLDSGLVLPVGGSKTYNVQYTPPTGVDGCGPFENTVTATGTATATDPDTEVSDSASATCHVSQAPAITLEKDCGEVIGGVLDVTDKNLEIGANYQYKFTIDNTGNVPLQNIVITDSKLGAPIVVPGILLPNDPPIVILSDIQTVGEPTSIEDCTIVNSASVTADSICPSDEVCPADTSVEASSGNCTLIVNCVPVITIDKVVACDLGDSCGTFAKTATGVRNGDCPAFCWQVTIVNTGFIPIGSLLVEDSVVPGFETAEWDLPIPAGGTRTVTISSIEYCDPETVNTVTATPYTGESATGIAGETVDSSATALVIPMSLTCEVALFYANDLDQGQGGANHVTVPAGSVDTSVEVSLTLNNTGEAAINVTTVNGLPPLVDCETGDPIDVGVALGLPLNIPAGESVTTFLGCWLVTCDGADGGSFEVTATAEADDDDGAFCVRNDAGDIITTDTEAPCPASVDCETPTECRTTGGGTLYNGDENENCVTVTTTLWPTEQNGLLLDHVSHGGQMGAPYANQDCANLLADPCIRGQWQHTRHYQGKGNPRHIIESDFHSNTPKGVFDTLKCECLGCCPNEEGNSKKGPNGEFTGWNQKFEVCNYGDFRICGPVPRPAPANALIWSGVGTGKFIGDTTTTAQANKTAEWMIIRVYVEDRSEPGGLHPKGGVDPSDVYVFQAWRTGVLVAKKADPNSDDILNALMPGQPADGVTIRQFRASLSADSCAFLSSVSKNGDCLPGTLPPTTVAGIGAAVYDQGPLRNGNRQIHPVTGATCTAEGGIPVDFPYPPPQDSLLEPSPYCPELE